MLLIGFASAAAAQTALSQKAPEAAEMLAIAQRDGHVRIIVQFAPPVPAGEIRPDPASIAAVKSRIAAVQDTIISAHFGSAQNPASGQGFERGINRFDVTPGFAVNVTGAELQELASDPLVTIINYDRLMPPILLQSVPLIGMPAAYAAGATGQGFAVAVLDTGTQSDHEFLSGKVIAEACFSNSGGGGGGVTLCPNGLSSQTGAGAAQPIGPCLNGSVNLCEHGTHVGGIAAGLQTNANPGAGMPTNGVAKNASILAIQVFTRINSAVTCGGSAPCVLSFLSDQVSALNFVFQNITLAGGVKVASVNMSLGGGPNTSSPCDGDPQKPSIDNLRGAGVLTAIAAGNDGSRSLISHPACISSALAIGSTTKSDTVSSFSNMANLVHSLAPGGETGGSCAFGANNLAILGPIAHSPPATNFYACLAGTSMATPHVAGAIAAIRTVCPNSTSDQIANALSGTGTPVTDTRAGGSITKPRIRVDLAAQSLACGGPAPGTMAVAPGTAIYSSGPQGGPFTPSAFNYQLSASTPVTFSITGLPSWLNVSSNVVTTPATVTFTVNAAANALNPDRYRAAIRFTNTTNGLGTTSRLAELTVNFAAEPVCDVSTPLGDFGGDGNSDIIFRRNDGAITLWQMNGGTVLSAAGLGSVGPEWNIVGIADLNGDGKADIVWRRVTDGSVAVWLMDGPSVLSAAGIGVVGTEWHIVGVRDFDGDGKADILWRRSTDGSNVIWFMNGTSVTSSAAVGIVGPEWHIYGVADFNADGRADILWRRDDGAVALWLMNGGSVLSAIGIGSVGTEWRIFGVADLSGDGKADIVFRRNDGSLTIWLMDGGTVLSATGLGIVGPEWTIAGVGDLNGDARADILWRRNDGAVSTWLMNGASVVSAIGVGVVGPEWRSCQREPGPVLSVASQ
jgi:hypothetical protein